MEYHRQFFINAIGTDIGKTFVLEHICHDIIAQKKNVSAIKPIISGFKKSDKSNDIIKILHALGREVNQRNIEEVSPWRFKDPISPNLAAKKERREVDFYDIVSFCQKRIIEAQIKNEYFFIEGAGGVMTPINKNRSFLDLMWQLQLPVILIVKNYLGCISHTLTAIEALKIRCISLAEIRFNFYDDSQLEILQTIDTFAKQRFPKVKVITHNFIEKLP